MESVSARVVVVDDHMIFRLGLARALHGADVQIVGEAATGKDAITVVRRERPDALLLDAALPDMDGFAVCEALTRSLPSLRVIFLTSYTDAASVRAARIAGACAVLSKDASPDAIAIAVRRSLSDLGWRDFPAEGTRIVSDREMDVLELLNVGMSQPEIARALDLSTETVKSYVRELYGKLGVHDRLTALREARRRGLLFDPPGSGVPRSDDLA